MNRSASLFGSFVSFRAESPAMTERDLGDFEPAGTTSTK